MTFQLGGFSSYCGSHFWNIQASVVSSYWSVLFLVLLSGFTMQEELLSYQEEQGVDCNFEISPTLFRSGQTERSQETYVPRLMILDVQGQRGSLRRTVIILLV